MKSEGKIFDCFFKIIKKNAKVRSAKAVLRNGGKDFASSNVIWNLERFESIRMNIVYYEIKSNLICKSKNVLKVLKISILIKVLFLLLDFSSLQRFKIFTISITPLTSYSYQYYLTLIFCHACKMHIKIRK